MKANLSVCIMARRLVSWTVSFISAFSFKIPSFMCIWTSQQWDQYFKYPFQYILDFLNLLRILPTAMWLDEYFFFFFFLLRLGGLWRKMLRLLQHPVCFMNNPHDFCVYFQSIAEFHNFHYLYIFSVEPVILNNFS